MDETMRKTFVKEQYDFEDLKRIVKKLRDPDGCPWDRAQTHESMEDCMIEEAFEVVEAVRNKDIANLREELGDVMLQVLLHTRIAEEEKEFTFEDVVDELSKKLIRRHPHVFGKEEAATTSMEGLSRWEAIKKQEKEAKGQDERGELLRIPHTLPPIRRAQKVMKKAEKLYGYSKEFDELKIEVEKLREAENALTNAIETFIKKMEG